MTTTTNATRSVRYCRNAGVMLITANSITTMYEVEKYESDFGEAYGIVKLDAASNPLIRYDVLIGGGEDGCTCPAGSYQSGAKPCRHYAALKALRDAGKLP